MSKTIPSPQTLRHLRRLVHATVEPSASTIATIPHPLRARQRPFQHAVQNLSQSTSRSPRAFSTNCLLNQQAPSQTHPSAPEPTTNANTNTDPLNSNPSSDPLPDITNYYTLFPQTLPSGPPPSSPFSIPLPTLRREFLSLQSKYHPDKFGTDTLAHTKSRALSSLLNNAYKTLSDPLLRARYLLLEMYGVDVTSEDNSLHGGVTDQETLLEVMEAQETLEEATSHEDIEGLMEENAVRIAETEKVLGQAFETEDVDEAKRECVRLNYWRSLQSALREWEPGKEVHLVH